MSETLYQRWQRDCELMRTACKEASERGKDAAVKEAAYYTAKAECALRMKADGYQVGIIDMTVKGQPEVASALLEYRAAEAVYKAACKAVDVYRDSARYLYDQIKREQSGDAW